MRYTHGDTGTRLYRIWKSMKCRCFDTTHSSYKHYGARGITMSSEWANDYICFKNWAIQNGYADHLEIDRIDVDGGYCPENCRWITHHAQTLNRRDTLYISVNGVREKLRDYCREHHINLNSVNAWRYDGVLEEKLSRIIGMPVKVSGGKVSK